MVTGKAHTNVFDGEKRLSEDTLLRGITRYGEVGFLTLFEAYGYYSVGKFLKNPRLPIWIVCSESHYSVLFAIDLAVVQKNEMNLDLVYYDELGQQEAPIVLSLK